MLNNLTAISLQELVDQNSAPEAAVSAPPAPPITQITQAPVMQSTTLTNVSTPTVLPPTLQIAQAIDFLTPIMATANLVAANLDNARKDELENVLAFLNSTGCYELMEFCTLESTPNNPNTHGRLQFKIPAERFHGLLAGHFQLKVLWPEINDSGKLVVKLSVGFKVEANGHATLLTTGGGRAGDNVGFKSINSATVDLADVLNAGYIADDHHERLMSVCVKGVGNSKSTPMLVPAEGTFVTFTVRNVIRPADNGKRPDLPQSTKEVGSQCGWGIAGISFSGAVMLPGLNALDNTAVTNKYSGRNYADFAREVNGNVLPTAFVGNGLTSTAPTNVVALAAAANAM